MGNKIGVNLEVEDPDLKELKEKLEKSQELVRKHEKEINNLRKFNDELEQNRAYYKEKYNRKIKNDNINENEFKKMKLKLRSSANDYEILLHSVPPSENPDSSKAMGPANFILI